MTLSNYTPSSVSRAHRAWKDAWFSFRALIWTRLEDPGWYWFSQALHMYWKEEPAVLAALRTEFDDLSWWESWKDWNDRYERLLPTSDDLREARLASPLPSDLPTPPDEPEGLWARTLDLWSADDRLLSIGGATIRTVLARGRATRVVRG